jgi:hypothetical protein
MPLLRKTYELPIAEGAVHTVPSGQADTVHGVVVQNTTNANRQVTVKLRDGEAGADIVLLNGLSITANTRVVCLLEYERYNLLAGDTVRGLADAAGVKLRIDAIRNAQA